MESSTVQIHTRARQTQYKYNRNTMQHQSEYNTNTMPDDSSKTQCKHHKYMQRQQYRHANAIQMHTNTVGMPYKFNAHTVNT